jgi:cell division septation protein DedD
MYRVIAIVIGGLALAACSSTPDWMNLDALKPAPMMDTVRFESEPPGAEAKTSNGQTCRTPCALALPANAPIAVTFTLNGYQPDSENIEPIANSNGLPEFRPNPVQVELTPAPPPVKPGKKPAAKKKTGAKPAAKPKPKTSAAPAPAPQAQQQAPAPWPATPAR